MTAGQELRDAVRDVLTETTGVTLTDEALQDLLDDELTAEVQEWGANDTEVRSRVANALTHALLSKRMPAYGDQLTPSEEENFHAELRTAAIQRGWSKSST